MRATLLLTLQALGCSALLLSGRVLPRVSDGAPVDVGAALAEPAGTTLCVLGTYPADFNMIEYAQLNGIDG